ncbi:hypothetical protein BHE74_00056129 [Ensete ventricosum]|nr:hypothetical protein BHE74_00056129 [Ensete ventricosum]
MERANSPLFVGVGCRNRQPPAHPAFSHAHRHQPTPPWLYMPAYHWFPGLSTTTASTYNRHTNHTEETRWEMASVVRKASWIAAASVGAVEALKDQGGLCRCNYAFRYLHQRAKNNMGSLSQAIRVSSSVSDRSSEKAKQSEESLRKVMFLSCWGPN